MRRQRQDDNDDGLPQEDHNDNKKRFLPELCLVCQKNCTTKNVIIKCLTYF